MTKLKPMMMLLLILISSITYGQTVTIDRSTQRFLGTVSTLDRAKYFTLHSNSNDADVQTFFNDYNVTKGRGFWGPYSYAKNQTGSVGTYPAYKGGSTAVRNVSRFISTEHPKNVVRWSADKVAGANWAVEYWKNFVDDAGRAEFFEPMNEPFVHAGDPEFSAEQPDQALMRERMAEWFGEIGLKIDQSPELANMKVVGYASAWPSMELWDFGHWNTRMKMFMDVAGQHMDAFSVHLYDGINVTGQDNRRSGSNSEAILDLIETYSNIKWGTVKDHAITEYGGIESGYGSDYSDIANAQSVKAINGILFNLLERENNMAISIPFITDKSTWHITAANNYQPYGAVLFKPSNIGQPNPTGWTYTPRIYFYELWRNVTGNRVDISTSDPDVQLQAFADGNKLYVALNNLDGANKTVNLNLVGGTNQVTNVRIKTLKIYDNANPVFSDNTQTTAPSSITLIPQETAMLEYTFSSAASYTNAIRSTKYYATAYLQAISANTAIPFTFNGVTTGTGKATLRMAISRKHNVSKAPVVKVNGTTVAVPTNWKGYDQANREDFFGTIEIPVDMSLIQANNTVTVTFPDNGGRVASMILQVEKYDNPVAANDSFVFTNPPTTLPSATSYDFEVTYSASQSRDLVVEFWSSTSWLAQKTVTVPAGSGTTTVTVNLSSAPPAGSGYIIKGSIRPVGGDWTTSLDTDQVNNVTVVANQDLFAFSNPPSELPSKTTYNISVDYSASQSRDLVVEFWSSTGWLAQGTTTINAGSGTATVVISLGSAPATGTGYILKGSIRPVGTDWTQNIDTDQVNNITVTANQEPYGGTAHAIPGVLQSEDYDTGGAGVAYYDATSANSGGSYRTDGVDLEACGEGGYNIGWTANGEWLEYTVNVAAAGTYQVAVRYASLSATGNIHIESGGTNLSGAISLPSTGAWQTYATVNATVTLPAGEQILRVHITAGNINLNHLTFTSSGGARLTHESKSSEELITVYPNPIEDGKFTLSIPADALGASYVLYNLQGAVMLSGRLEDVQTALEVKALKPGVYMLQAAGEYRKIQIK